MTTPHRPPTMPTTPRQQSYTEPPTKTTPNDDHLVVHWNWKNDGTISTSIANWIPPDNDTSSSASQGPTKKLSKGLLHAQDILGKCNDPTETGTTEPINLDGPRNTPLEYLKCKQTPQDSFDFDRMHWMMTTKTTRATALTMTMTDSKAKENIKCFHSQVMRTHTHLPKRPRKNSCSTTLITHSSGLRHKRCHRRRQICPHPSGNQQPQHLDTHHHR